MPKRSRRVFWFEAFGNSMEPAIRTGDRLLVEAVLPGEIREGAILLYQSASASTLVCHRVRRVIRRGERVSFLVRGDNSAAFDSGVEFSRVKGKVAGILRGGRFYVPRFGWALARAAQVRDCLRALWALGTSRRKDER